MYFLFQLPILYTNNINVFFISITNVLYLYCKCISNKYSTLYIFVNRKNVFIYCPYYNKPEIGSFKKEGGSGGGIRTDYLSILSFELYRRANFFLE